MRNPAVSSTTLVLLLAIGAETGAQHAYRLSAPLERAPVGKVRDARASRDGRRCLYRAEPRGDGLASLYRAAIDGSEPVVEFGRTASGPGQYELDASGENVLHLVRDPDTGLRRLVARRGDGTGDALVLDGGVGEVLDFHLAPAGDLVLVRATTASSEAELFAAPTRGGRVFRVNGPLSAGESVESDYVLGPDGRSVYYRQDFGAGRVELFRGSVVSRPPRRLCAPHAPGSAVLEFALTPDHARVVYRADSRANNVIELFVAPAAGTGTPQRVPLDLPVNADVRDFALSPDGSRIVFRADGGTFSKLELFSAPSDGLAVTRLNQDLGSSADVLDFQVTPDSTAAVFRANADGVANQELFLAPLDGSSPARRLGPDLGAGENVHDGYVLRDDKVLYGVDPGAGWQAYVLALDVGAQPVPFGPPALGERALLATSTHFLAMTDAGLLSVPVDLSSPPALLDGPNPILLDPLVTDPVEPGEGLLFLRTTTFDGPGNNVETTELRSVLADASRPSLAVSAPFPKLAIIESVLSHSLRADPSGKYVAYTTVGASRRLFLVESSGRGEPLLVATSPQGVGAFTHDGARFLYVDAGQLRELVLDGSGVHTDLLGGVVGFGLATQANVALVRTSATSGYDLLALRLDGSAPVDLLAGLPAALTFQGFADLSHDGRWAAYGVADGSGAPFLCRVPTDGSALPELVPAPGFFAFSPDGTALAFLQGQDLHRVALVSGASPSFVHTFAGTARFPEFYFDPQGNDLIVLDAGDVHLYPASGAARHLNSAHPGAAEAVQLAPTGGRALYATWNDALAGTFDLWSVPFDGSTPAVRVNADAAGQAFLDFLGNWSGSAFDVTPDGSHVAFTSAGRLMVGRVDGSQPPAVLADDPGRFWGFPPTEFTADSRTLVYSSQGLFAVALSGGREPRQLDSPVPGSGQFSGGGFVVLGQRRGVLFLAGPPEEGPDELFLGVLDRAVRGVPR
ncbi:MAG: hypothetical protein ABL998_11200 [Planctomycetota bacterium]